jgi:hypothetical protein
MSGVNFCAAAMLPLILIAPLHNNRIHQQKPPKNSLNQNEKEKKQRLVFVQLTG